MPWIIDAQLPPVSAHFPVREGEDATHVSEVMLIEASDTDIWNHAINPESVIVTKGEDFHNRVALATTSPFVVWLRYGNCSTRTVIAKRENVLNDLVSRIESGEAVIEV